MRILASLFKQLVGTLELEPKVRRGVDGAHAPITQQRARSAAPHQRLLSFPLRAVQLVTITVPEGTVAKGGKLDIDGVLHLLPHRVWCAPLHTRGTHTHRTPRSPAPPAHTTRHDAVMTYMLPPAQS